MTDHTGVLRQLLRPWTHLQHTCSRLSPLKRCWLHNYPTIKYYSVQENKTCVFCVSIMLCQKSCGDCIGHWQFRSLTPVNNCKSGSMGQNRSSFERPSRSWASFRHWLSYRHGLRFWRTHRCTCRSRGRG